MGIQGLLPLLKSIQEPCNLKAFAGQTIGVDAYGWLHRGCLTCILDLAFGKDTSKFVDFAMNRVRMLKHFGVIPYIVFDGDYLPSKAVTEAAREAKRATSRKLGLELHRMNKISQANSELQKAVDVTPEMARQLIEELKINNIQYVVAPYEADAQLVFLEKKSIIQGILSEDSDMLVFGAQRLLTKLDQYGDCVLFRRARFTACREVNLAGWSDKEFRTMTIMSGCDYLPSIDKMGLKTAHRLVRKYKTIEKILTMLAFDGKFRIPPAYLESFKKAELTFLYQRVFCPDSNMLIMANDLKGYDYELAMRLGNLDFAGKEVDPHIALSVARGDLHPMTKKPLDFARREYFKSWSGSRYSDPPRTPSSSSRRHGAVTISDLKSNKSITSYLQPGRTPLAEISPNVWRSSPAVSDVMRYQGEAVTDVLRSMGASIPQANPIPTGGRRSSSQRNSLSGSQQQLTPTSLPAPRFRVPPSPPQQQTSNTTFNQAKRQRLCDEPIESESLATGSYSENKRFQSRFFASSRPDQSPSIVPRRGRRKIEREIVIWSDAPEDLKDPEGPQANECQANECQAKRTPSRKFEMDVMRAEQSLDSEAVHTINDVKVDNIRAAKCMKACEDRALVSEEIARTAQVTRDDIKKQSAMVEKGTDEYPAPWGKDDEKTMKGDGCNNIVVVPESPVASGLIGILCKGSEDAMIPDSEEDEEGHAAVDNQPVSKLDLGKFLFRC